MTVVANIGALPFSSKSAHCCVTSPPYFRRRDYGVAGQLGWERDAASFVLKLAAAFDEVRRVLRDDGLLWVVVDDTVVRGAKQAIPWRLALALVDRGWQLRSEVIWHKPNVLPHGSASCPRRSHETVLLLTPSAGAYYYDPEAIKEAAKFARGTGATRERRSVWTIPHCAVPGHHATFPEELVRLMIAASTSDHGVCADCGAQYSRLVEKARVYDHRTTRQPTPSSPYLGQPDVRRGVLTVSKTLGWEAGCACGSGVVPALVLDPFVGSGTTARVATSMGRRCAASDLSRAYVQAASRKRGDV
jgi:site-specific DNA-methyltransferase (adenine-specific)